MAELTFSDSLDDNMNTIRELIGNLPPTAQHRARQVAEKIRVVVEQVKKDYPKDPAAGIGIVFAVHFIAQEMTKDNRKLIRLLS